MGKVKKPQDPMAPKKPASSFMEFSKLERRKVAMELGISGFHPPEVLKEVGRRWRGLEEQEKKVYEDKARDNVKKYEFEMKKYFGSKALKKPPTAYLEFVKEERLKVQEEVGLVSNVEMSKELGKRWKNLPKDDKQVFEKRYKDNMKLYYLEMEKLKEKKNSESDSSAPAANFLESSQEIAAEYEESFIPPPDNSSSVGDSNLPVEEPSPGPSTLPPEVSPSLSSLESSAVEILAENLGFAKQKKFPWHPALRTGGNARGSRIYVTYFGTAQTGIVDKSGWLPFSPEVEVRITTPRMIQDSSFRKGLDQLKNMLAKVDSSADKPFLNDGVGYAPQPTGRRLVKMTKDGLQKDEEQNEKLMKEKIVEIKDGKMRFGCKDCTWEGQFRHKAKAHARDCGARRKENPSRKKVKKFDCSRCELSFQLLSNLKIHYRYMIFINCFFIVIIFIYITRSYKKIDILSRI